MRFSSKSICTVTALSSCVFFTAVPAQASPPPSYTCDHITLLPNHMAIGRQGCVGGYHMPKHGKIHPTPFRFFTWDGTVFLICDSGYADVPNLVVGQGCNH